MPPKRHDFVGFWKLSVTGQLYRTLPTAVADGKKTAQYFEVSRIETDKGISVRHTYKYWYNPDFIDREDGPWERMRSKEIIHD